jgi:hypothetical protein
VVTVCWSVKGGSGTTVVAAALAVLQSQRAGGALLVDLAGDALAALGTEASDPADGVRSWLGADPSVGAEALIRLEVPVGRMLHVLPAGAVPIRPPSRDRWELLGSHLHDDARPVVADLGSSMFNESSGRGALLASARTSLLVLRPCYLALRRAVHAPRPTGVVLVREEGRALGVSDVEAALGVGVIAEVAFDPAIARAVDAGLLNTRLPRILERSLRRAA